MSAEDLQKWANRAKPGMPLFEGPSDVREAFIASHGIDWTASYIDPAVWIPHSRTIVTRTRIAAERIGQNASIMCGKMGVKVRPPSAGDSQRMAAA
jgi:hypothetical protein